MIGLGIGLQHQQRILLIGEDHAVVLEIGTDLAAPVNRVATVVGQHGRPDARDQGITGRTGRDHHPQRSVAGEGQVIDDLQVGIVRARVVVQDHLSVVLDGVAGQLDGHGAVDLEEAVEGDILEAGGAIGALDPAAARGRKTAADDDHVLP